MTTPYIQLGNNLFINGGASAEIIVTNAPSVGQVLVATSASTATWQAGGSGGSPSGPAGGDLGGSYPNPTVVGLQGDALPSPSGTNTVLTWNGSALTWATTGGGGSPSGPAGGDLSGSYPNPTVAKVNAVAYPATPSTNTLPVVTGSNTVTYQQIADAQVASAAAIAGTKISPNFGSQNIITAGNLTISSLSTGVVHSDSSGNFTSSLLVNADVSASAAIAYSKLSLSNSIVNADLNTAANIAVTKLAAGTAAQLLVNNATPAPTWTSLSGDATLSATGALTNTQARGLVTATTTVSVSGATAPTTGQVLTATSSTNATWQTPATAAITQLTGDVTAGPGSGSVAASVVKIQGTAVNASSPTSNQLLQYDSVDGYWRPATISSLPPSGSAGGDLSGSYPNPTVAKLQGTGVSGTGPTTNQLLQYNGTAWTPTTIASLPPSGSAGGDLSGSYPNPTVAKINAASVPAAGSLTTGNVLQVNGVSSLTYAAVNLAGGANFVTGALPTANQVAQSLTLTGDATSTGGTTAGATTVVAQVNGVAYPAAPSTNTVPVVMGTNTVMYQALTNSQISASAAVAVSKLAAGTSAQFLVNNATPTPTWTTLSGDVTSSATGALTVNSISGSSPIAITPSNLQWATATATPKLSQADNTTNSATGATLTIQAQNATGTTTNGGVLNLSSGTGTTSAGAVNLLCGGTSILTCNPTSITPGVNAWQWGAGASGPALSQSQQTSNVAGKNLSVSAQQGQAANNTQGGNLLLNAGAGGGTGLAGAVRLQLPSTTNVMLEVTQLASTSKIVSLCANGLALTTTQMPTNSGNGVIFLAGATANPSANCNNTGIVLYTDSAHFNFTSRDNIGTVADMTPFSAGTVNTQIQKQLKFVQYGRLTTTGTTLTISIPLATATTNCNLQVNTLAKIATAGSLNAAGDTFNDNKVATFKNVAGTVTQVGSSVDLTTSQSDASLSTSAITFTISGTNIVVTFTANATSGTLGNCDVSIWVTQTIN